MKLIDTTIPGVLILEPKLFYDNRGYFFESYNRMGSPIETEFVQDNHSVSCRGVLRGLHYQCEHPQGKLVRVVYGSIYDVAVDIRVGSDTYGKWFAVELNDYNHRQLWIPPGLAHGFLVLSDKAVVLYKVTDYRYPEYERTIIWNDSTLDIRWPFIPIALSEKDKAGDRFIT